jgi:NAD(P)-dependent dehydrogenase (short-subunit alcohol dehydrogenase family)
MDLGLQGKHAIVTGGSRGIGKAIAHELAREGADVAIVARNQADLEASARDLTSETNRRIIPLAADVTSKEQVERVVAEAAQQLGGLHILVNSGSHPGGSATATGPIETVVDEDLIEDFNIKYVGALRCARAVIPFMKEAGWGRIINISGGNARNAGNLSGGARNAALVHMTKTLSVQLGRHGITVNCIHPGTTRTERTPGPARRPRRSTRRITGGGGAARLRAGFAARQRHLPHGRRLGSRLRRSVSRLGQGLGGLRRTAIGQRRRRPVGLLLSRESGLTSL